MSCLFDGLDPIADGSYLESEFPCHDATEGADVHEVEHVHHDHGCSCLECGMYFGAGFFFGMWMS